MNRYLIYSTYYPTPHFETEMDIAKQLIQAGKEVFFLTCKSYFQTCFVNINHHRAICNVCQSKVEAGLKELSIPKNRIIQFPNVPLYHTESFLKERITSIETLKAFKYKGSDIGLAVASSIISIRRDHRFDINAYWQDIVRGINTAQMVHDATEIVFEQIKPDAAILFNGRLIENRPFMRLCERSGITFYTHERGGLTNKYSFIENSTPHSLERIKKEIETTWQNADINKEKIGVSFFEGRRNGAQQSWYSFIKNQEKGLLPSSFDKKKFNISIFNSSMDEYETIPDFDSKIYQNDNDGIEKICAAFEHNLNYQFYLRVHPYLKGLRNTQIKELEKLAAHFKNITIIRPSEKIDSYALMEASDSIISFGSTMGVEALYWGVPSLLAGRAYYEDLKGLLKPSSHEQVVEMIENIKINDKTNPSTQHKDEAIKYGYWCLTFGTPYQYFTPTGISSGTFSGKKISPTRGQSSLGRRR